MADPLIQFFKKRRIVGHGVYVHANISACGGDHTLTVRKCAGHIKIIRQAHISTCMPDRVICLNIRIKEQCAPSVINFKVQIMRQVAQIHVGNMHLFARHLLTSPGLKQQVPFGKLFQVGLFDVRQLDFGLLVIKDPFCDGPFLFLQRKNLLVKILLVKDEQIHSSFDTLR